MKASRFITISALLILVLTLVNVFFIFRRVHRSEKDILFLKTVSQLKAFVFRMEASIPFTQGKWEQLLAVEKKMVFLQTRGWSYWQERQLKIHPFQQFLLSWKRLKKSNRQLVRQPSILHRKELLKELKIFFGYLEEIERTAYLHLEERAKSLYDNILLLGLNVVFIGWLLFYVKQEVRDKLEKYSLEDELTGLLNRHSYNSIVASECSRMERYGGVLSMLVMDLDHFKKINDTWGHAFGDIALKKFAILLRSNTRKSDYVFRIGGEEFVILATETTAPNAEKLAQKIHNLLADAPLEKIGNLSVSIGIAEYSKGMDAETLFQQADKALYQAKQAGRAQSVVFQED